MKRKENYLERVSYDWSSDSIRLIHTPSQTARSVYFYIQEAGYFKTNPAYFTERKNLNSFLMVYTISGNGQLFYEGEEYTLSSGTCFYINCMNHHLYKNLKTQEWEFYWIHFQGINALGYYEEFVKNGFRIMEVQEQVLFRDTIKQLVAIHQKMDMKTEPLASKLIVTLLTEMLIGNRAGNIKSNYMPDYLKQIMKEIDIHFAESHSLDQLAGKYGVNKFHLSKEFKRYVGTTLNEYIIRTRLSHAKELLKYSELSVSQIAEQCGIPNTSHFINLFKNREDSTPHQYRLEWNQ